MNRLRSLDVFRGATVALMILVNNPGSWSHIYPPLAHAQWHGATPTDLVFPFFLFAVGNALALVLPRLREQPSGVFWRKVGVRTALIFGIGLLLNAAPFVQWDSGGSLVPRDWHSLRLMGVLQRIGLCFGAAAVIVWLGGRRGAFWAAVALLLGYWAACVAWGAPGDPYSLDGWFGTAVDRALLGASHLYRGEGVPFDPEGLASTPPAIAQVLLGWWVGDMLRSTGAPDRALVLRLLRLALPMLLLALAWHLVMPINKKIWTSSYVLLTTALAMMTLAGLVYLLEVRAHPSRCARPFEVFGRNALFVFVLSGLLPRFLSLWRWPAEGGAAAWTSPLRWIYEHGFAGIGSDPRLGSLLFACTNLAFYGLLAWWLDHRRIYIRV
ncbi:MAG TPA: heparan-alpha-glucosaminide N-acetyltransferase domain-containing protein [Rubrivivax sp.]|nr:heparan-alpha-glucosaminide N-acetyltransferase domain-containing protein [Rubrivivax sp.]